MKGFVKELFESAPYLKKYVPNYGLVLPPQGFMYASSHKVGVDEGIQKKETEDRSAYCHLKKKGAGEVSICAVFDGHGGSSVAEVLREQFVPALAKEFLKETKVKFLNADEIAKSADKNLVRTRIKAGKIFLKRFDKLVDEEESFAVESTLSDISLAKNLKKVRRLGYKITVIYSFLDNPNMAIDRIKVRVEKGGHFIPNEDVIRRFYRSKNNFWKIYRNIANDWSIFYNGEDDDRLIPVATGSMDEVNILEEEKFSLFIKDVDNDKRSI